MEVFATDLERLEFLLEAEAEFHLVAEAMSATGQSDDESPAADAADKKEKEPQSEAPEAVKKESEEQGELPPEKRPKYITNYIGSKQKLVDWIWKNTPDDVKSVLDAFSGSAVVAYMFKSKGLQVTANDRLRYCSHAARAIVENSKEQLSPEEIEALVAENPKAGTFVRDNQVSLHLRQQRIHVLAMRRTLLPAIEDQRVNPLGIFAHAIPEFVRTIAASFRTG